MLAFIEAYVVILGDPPGGHGAVEVRVVFPETCRVVLGATGVRLVFFEACGVELELPGATRVRLVYPKVCEVAPESPAPKE